jgi:hypothetical protein
MWAGPTDYLSTSNQVSCTQSDRGLTYDEPHIR